MRQRSHDAPPSHPRTQAHARKGVGRRRTAFFCPLDGWHLVVPRSSAFGSPAPPSALDRVSTAAPLACRGLVVHGALRACRSAVVLVMGCGARPAGAVGVRGSHQGGAKRRRKNEGTRRTRRSRTLPHPLRRQQRCVIPARSQGMRACSSPPCRSRSPLVHAPAGAGSGCLLLPTVASAGFCTSSLYQSRLPLCCDVSTDSPSCESKQRRVMSGVHAFGRRRPLASSSSLATATRRLSCRRRRGWGLRPSQGSSPTKCMARAHALPLARISGCSGISHRFPLLALDALP